MEKIKETKLLRAIPKVDEFLRWIGPEEVAQQMEQQQLVNRFKEILDRKMTPRYRPVINGTGVVVHTNLGRSLLPPEAMKAIHLAGSRYGNLEFSLDTGKRGSRYSLVEELLCSLTGAEAALVVNNNAAAVLLVLETLAAGREVVVSRGQLVEIGGSFRIPEVMAKSGARLVEVGATNRTHLKDYERAITEETALLLKVHTSNFRIIGFTSEVSLPQLVELAARHQLPVMEDLGSGSLIDLSPYGLVGEPTVSEVLRQGVDVVTFSGDKMLGGPQAGIIAGRRTIIEQVKRNPMNRAMRIDKFTLAGLESVLRLYLDEETALDKIPTLAMITQPLQSIGRRAERLRRRIARPLAGRCIVEKRKVDSRVGGGSLPEQSLSSWAVCLQPVVITVNALEERLRGLALPVIGRIEQDRFILDMRCVLDDEVTALGSALIEVFGEETG
ncbi:MAG: L-seryl-tRNA(Sec) selenium transferase [Deltaproteobacteria bacterium]